jgi:hypothetical protein
MPYAPEQKKSRPSEEEPGLLCPPSQPLHRRLNVKRIQAGILAYGSSYSLPLPTHLTFRPFDKLRAQGSGLRAVVPVSFVPDHSGVAVPESHGIPFSA